MASEMAQKIKSPSANPDNLGSVSRTNMVEGENSLSHQGTLWHLHLPWQTHPTPPAIQVSAIQG